MNSYLDNSTVFDLTTEHQSKWELQDGWLFVAVLVLLPQFPFFLHKSKQRMEAATDFNHSITHTPNTHTHTPHHTHTTPHTHKTETAAQCRYSQRQLTSKETIPKAWFLAFLFPVCPNPNCRTQVDADEEYARRLERELNSSAPSSYTPKYNPMPVSSQVR